MTDFDAAATGRSFPGETKPCEGEPVLKMTISGY